jgi:hypothetical protein
MSSLSSCLLIFFILFFSVACPLLYSLLFLPSSGPPFHLVFWWSQDTNPRPMTGPWLRLWVLDVYHETKELPLCFLIVAFVWVSMLKVQQLLWNELILIYKISFSLHYISLIKVQKKNFSHFSQQKTFDNIAQSLLLFFL